MRSKINSLEIETITKRILEGEYLSDIANEKKLNPHTIIVNVWSNELCFSKLAYELLKGANDNSNLEKTKRAALKEFNKLHQDSIEVIGYLEEINNGSVVTAIARDKFVSRSTIYKKIERCGFEYNKTLNKWIHEDNESQQEIEKLISAIDVEAEVEEISDSRYEFEEGIFYDEVEIEDIGIYKPILDEFKEKAENMGVENVEELVTLALLKYLDTIDPKERKEYEEE